MKKIFESFNEYMWNMTSRRFYCYVTISLIIWCVLFYFRVFSDLILIFLAIFIFFIVILLENLFYFNFNGI